MSLDIILSPHITEKGTLISETANQVIFRVRRDANKNQIHEAIEKFFGVKVTQVHTVIQRGKTRQVGRSSGRRPDWKKAYVTLAEGSRIDFFGGA